MILSFFGSKVGILIIAFGICALFFGLSKWKHRSSRAEPATRIQRVAPRRASEEVAMLSRVQEHAVARADDVRSDRQQKGTKGESYDEVGNVYRRRATPDPISNPTTTSADTSGQQPLDTELLNVPALRIHGRRSVASALTDSKWANPLTALVPKALKSADGLTGPGASSTKAARPDRFVPFGRLIKAELVITLESTQDEMPLVGIITEPVYNNGRLVIPAGTELHSMARPDRIRDRIVSISVWRMIFPREGNRPNGRQLVFDGMALDREDRDGNGLTWGLTDGSYGLRGRAIHSGQASETLMLFAAEAIKAASSSLMDRQETILGTQVEANARNASLAGSQAVLSHYAEGIAKELERNGTYIQVPAGKEFYVYPRQVIDPDRADIPENIAKVE